MIGRRIKSILCTIVLFTLWNCGGQKTAGTTTQTENAVSLRILTSEGKPAAGVAYSVLPMWYVADSNGTTDSGAYLYKGFTDTKGWIRINNHPAGHFQIQMADQTYGVVSQYSLRSDSAQLISEEIALKKKGGVSGQVNLPEDVAYAWVFILGLDRVARTDSLGTFLFSDLPVGQLRLVAVSATDANPLGDAVVQIPEGDTSTISSFDRAGIDEPLVEAWRYSQKLEFRSLVSDWMRPLPSKTVLTLRLDSANFDFSQAQKDGRDILVLDAKDQPLPIQIDYWDATFHRGVVRIAINTASDTVGDWTLLWGNPFASLTSTNVWLGLPDSLVLAINSVLLADFENGSSQNALLPPATSFHWYSATGDSNATISPAKNEPFTNALKPAANGRTGTAASISYTATSPKYAMIGTRMASEGRCFAHLDSLELWVRGNGNYAIILENLDLENNMKTVYNANNQDAWTRVAIRPQDFSAADSIGGNYGWNVVKDSITTFTVFLNGGTSFWIDDIRFYGINRDDLK